MSRRQWLSPMVVLVAPAQVLGAEVFLKEDDAPKTMFAAGDSSVRKTVALTAAELEKLSLAIGRKVELSKYSYFEVRVGAELLGRIFLLDVVGQSQPISFAIAVKPDGEVHDVQVLVYREAHGDEIRDRRFRRQFTGKKVRDSLVFGKDIEAVSGATISSRAATFAVKKALGLHEVVAARDADSGL